MGTHSSNSGTSETGRDSAAISLGSPLVEMISAVPAASATAAPPTAGRKTRRSGVSARETMLAALKAALPSFYAQTGRCPLAGSSSSRRCLGRLQNREGAQRV